MMILSLFTYLLPNLLTLSSRVLLEKLTSSQLVKKSPHFMEPGGSLPLSQVPAICPYPDTIPFKIFVFWEMHFYSIYTSILVVGTTRVQTFLSSLLNWIYPTVSFKRRQPSDSLWAGGSVNRMPLGARFSALVQTGCGPIQTPIQWKIGVKQSGRGFHNPLPFYAENKEKVQLHFFLLSGFSWTLLQCILFTWHHLKETEIIRKDLWTNYQYLWTNYQHLWTNYQYLWTNYQYLWTNYQHLWTNY